VLLVNHGEARVRVRDFVSREALALSVLLDPNSGRVAGVASAGAYRRASWSTRVAAPGTR